MIRRKILFRYTIKELFSPFVLGLLIFTFILLMNKILKLMDMVINKGVGIGEVGTLILFLMPSLLVMTIPMSILLAILICLGKFSGDSEITAMKASGISLHQMLPPFAVFCVFGFVLTSVLTLYLLPRANYTFRNHLFELAKKYSEATLEEGVFNDSFEGMVIYVNRFDRQKNRINGILISDKKDPDLPTVIVAEEAKIFSDPETGGFLFKLFKGSLHRLDRKSKSYQYAVFNTYEMNLQLEGPEDERKLKKREMGIGELMQISRDRKKTGRSSARIDVEIHKRFAFPFACLVFGLLGVSLGVTWRRGGRSYGFVFSIVIVFLYYLLLSIGENLAKSGYVFPFMGIWMPNVVLGIFGLTLFRKVAREEPVPLQWIGVLHLKPAIIKTKQWFKKKTGKK